MTKQRDGEWCLSHFLTSSLSLSKQNSQLRKPLPPSQPTCFLSLLFPRLRFSLSIVPYPLSQSPSQPPLWWVGDVLCHASHARGSFRNQPLTPKTSCQFFPGLRKKPMVQWGSINIPLFSRVHEYKEYEYYSEKKVWIVSETKWTLSKKKNAQRYRSRTQTHAKQQRTKWFQNPKRKVALRVPLKLHQGSKLSLSCLHKWLKNRCQSWVAVEPPRSTGINAYKGKNHTSTIRKYDGIWSCEDKVCKDQSHLNLKERMGCNQNDRNH